MQHHLVSIPKNCTAASVYLIHPQKAVLYTLQRISIYTSLLQAPLSSPTFHIPHLPPSAYLPEDVFNQNVNQSVTCERLKLNPIEDTQDNTAVKTVSCLCDNNPVTRIRSPSLSLSLSRFHSSSLLNLLGEMNRCQISASLHQFVGILLFN